MDKKSLFYCLFCLFFISACTTPTKPRPKPVTRAPLKPVVTDITASSEKVIVPTPIEIAQHLLQDAKASKNTEQRIHYQLQAIDIYLQEKRWDLAQQQLHNIDPLYLSLLQQDIYRLYSARLALYNNNLSQALTLVQQPPTNTEGQIWQQYHLLRAQIYQQQQHFVQAAQEYILRGTLLSATTDILQNQQFLWQVLATLSLHHQIIHAEKNPELAAWMELWKLTQTHRSIKKLQLALQTWQQQYPNHPVSDVFLQQLQQQRQTFFQQPQHIGVLLPLSGKLKKYGQIILEGIMSAYYHTDSSPKISIYDTYSDRYGAWNAYQQASDEGVDIMIGPLDKETVQSFAQVTHLPIPLLALNQSEKENHNPQLYQFALSPEDEARKVALRAAQDGYQRSVILYPDNAWGKRMSHAFNEYWQHTLHLYTAETHPYSLKKYDFSDTITRLLNIDESKQRYQQLRHFLSTPLTFTPYRRQDVDVVILFAGAKQARQIVPQLQFYHAEDLPVYSSAKIMRSPPDQNLDQDVNGVRFADMPWVIENKKNMSGISNNERNIALQRLFAMGVDAYHLLPHIKILAQYPKTEVFYGETGLLYFNTQQQIHRILTWATYQNGLITPLDK